MKYILAALAALALGAVSLAHAGVNPGQGANQMSQSGAKIAVKKEASEQKPAAEKDDASKEKKAD